MHYYIYETDFGSICICEYQGAISHVLFGAAPPDMRSHHKDGAAVSHLHYKETRLIERTALQLSQYLNGKRAYFDLPLSPEGTSFQKRVWSMMQSIPYGDTVSCGKLAKAIGVPGGARAVSIAHHKNPISILIPDHRVMDEQEQEQEGDPIKKSLMAMEHRRHRRPVGSGQRTRVSI